MYVFAGPTKNLPKHVETLGKAGRPVKSSLANCRAPPAAHVAYWRARHQKHTQIYRVGARAWADGPVWGLHLRNHLRGTYGALTGSFWNFPSRGVSARTDPPGGAQREP